MAIPVYNTGTVSVAADGTDVFNGGTAIWSNGTVKEGDWIVIDGEALTMVLAVVDTEHITIPPWQGGDKTNVEYALYQNYSARDDSSAIARDVGILVAALNKEGFIWFVGPDESEPDPSRGDEGQYAYQPNTGKKWVKTGGLWDYLGISDALFSRYDLTVDFPGRPESGMVMASWIVPSTITLSAGLPQSIGKARVAATASKTLTLKRNGGDVGAVIFGAGATVPTMEAISTITCNTGDVIDLVAPAVRDATLADLIFAFVALR